jgi:glycosyltransferase involved in cell wall biosynthesis
MRAGLPVLASDVGGVSELVDDGVTGTLVAREDVDGLGRALRAYVTDPGLRAAHGSAGRARFEQHFTFERLVEETVAVYERALRSRRSS